MRRVLLVFFGVGVCTVVGLAQSATSTGPYKVLKAARVGGEGGWDYIYADTAGRRLYIPRGAVQARAATDNAPALEAVDKRLTIWNLDTLDKVGEIAGVGGNGTAVCPRTGHGFTSDHPKPSMFDVATMKFIKNIDIPNGFQPDGIYCDTFNDRVYIFSHPTKSALAIDAKDGTVLANIDLGGTPEQGVADGKGTLFVVMQDRPGSVAVVDVKTMKTTAHYPLGDNGGCNGLALDAKNKVLFAACAVVGPAPQSAQRGPAAPAPVPGAAPPQTFVILSAKDGAILARLPLAAGSDGATFNPQTMEAFSTGGGTLTIVKEKSAKAFESVQVLPTMGNSRTIAFDSKTGHILTMAQEIAPPPPAAPGATPAAGGRGGGRGSAVPGSFTILMIGK